MKKVLVINTKYKKYGGEDSNFVDEIKFLDKYYSVDYLKESPWIHMPFEKYETTNIKDFKFEK